MVSNPDTYDCPSLAALMKYKKDNPNSKSPIVDVAPTVVANENPEQKKVLFPVDLNLDKQDNEFSKLTAFDKYETAENKRSNDPRLVYLERAFPFLVWRSENPEKWEATLPHGQT
jgi:hypothetical protein